MQEIKPQHQLLANLQLKYNLYPQTQYKANAMHKMKLQTRTKTKTQIDLDKPHERHSN